MNRKSNDGHVPTRIGAHGPKYAQVSWIGLLWGKHPVSLLIRRYAPCKVATMMTHLVSHDSQLDKRWTCDLVGLPSVLAMFFVVFVHSAPSNLETYQIDSVW